MISFTKSLAVVSLLATSFTPVFAYNVQELLPKDSVILSVNNLTKFREAAKKSCVGKAFHNKEVKKSFQNKTIFDMFRGKKDDELKAVTKLGNSDFDSLKGELHLAISLNAFEGKKSGSVFAITEQNEEEFSKSRESDKKISILEKKEVTTTTYEFQDITIYVDKQKKKGVLHTNYSAIVGKYSVFARDNKEWVEKTIIKILEEAPEPTESDVPNLKITVNTQAAIELLRKKAKTPKQAELTNATIQALGLNNLKHITLTLTPKDEAFNVVAEIGGLSDEKGIMTLIDTTPVPMDYRLSYVPKNTFNYSITRFNIQKFFDNISPIMNAINPDMLKQGKVSLMPLENMLGLNLYDKIIVPIGSSLYINYVSFRNKELENTSIFTVSDPQMLESSLNQISTKFPMLKRETFLDHSVYSVSKGENTPNAQVFSATIANEVLFIGLEKGVHNIIRTINAQKESSSQFYNSTLFERQQEVPENAFSFTLYDLKALIKTLSQKQDAPTSMALSKVLKKHNSSIKLDKIATYFTDAITFINYENGTLKMTLKIYNKQ